MVAAIINYIVRFVGFFWLTGPVFDKELRISSRKRRNYILRFAYISLLLTILLFIWIQVIDYRATDIVQISRMAHAGKYIVACIVCFQFIAAQLIAIVMLSNSISDEIYHKTLGMLMTTPITSLQIVMGKLLSKLLQLLLLLAISMPLLAIARLFGGVPWTYVTSSLCITLTTVLFVSSLSLFYSIFHRRAYRVIIITFLTLFLCFVFVPFLIVTIISLTRVNNGIDERVVFFIIYQPNPYLTFMFNTITMIEPRTGLGAFYNSVYLNSAFISILSFFLLLLSIVMVRKVALRQATGRLISSRQRKSLEEESMVSAKRGSSFCVSVVGPPVFWKELILPLRKSIKISRIIGIILLISLLFYSYWYNAKKETFDFAVTHFIYVIIFLVLGLFSTLVLSPTNITSEKESRSWPLLLSSTLNDNQIIIGKFLGVLSRCLPVWGLLLGHVFYFSIAGMIHPAGPFLTVIYTMWIIFFLCSSGIYFSSCFKHTTAAVIMNFLLAIFIWGIIPLFLGLVSVLSDNPMIVRSYMSFNPFVQIVILMQGTVGNNINRGLSSLQFNWGYEKLNFMETFFIVFKTFIVYIAFAFLFLWRAKKRLRRKIF